MVTDCEDRGDWPKQPLRGRDRTHAGIQVEMADIRYLTLDIAADQTAERQDHFVRLSAWNPHLHDGFSRRERVFNDVT